MGKATLKEMCEQFDVTPRTLRYYEYIELLQPERVGRRRYYNTAHKARLKLILNGKRWGFSLEEVRQWLELYQSGDANHTKVALRLEKAAQQLEKLEYKKLKIEEAICELRHYYNQTAAQLKAMETNV